MNCDGSFIGFLVFGCQSLLDRRVKRDEGESQTSVKAGKNENPFLPKINCPNVCLTLEIDRI